MKKIIIIICGILISTMGFSQSATTSLQVQNVSDTRVWIEWQETNDTALHLVNYFKVRYNIVGNATTLFKQKNYDYNNFPLVRMRLQNLSPDTEYAFQIKTVFNDGSTTSYSDTSFLTTGVTCPNVGSLNAYGINPTRAGFDWDDSNGSYGFARIKMRVDSISSPSSSDWLFVGGAGVFYGTFTKNKNGLTAGETYRAQARTWCGSVPALPYKSSSWTSLVTWTQPAASRLEGGESISTLDVYPNPSRDIFNISFTSEDIQDLRVKVLNVVGEILVDEDLQQFIGEYTKQIDLTNNAKGIYFLEIETYNRIINKKLILQ